MQFAKPEPVLYMNSVNWGYFLFERNPSIQKRGKMCKVCSSGFDHGKTIRLYFEHCLSLAFNFFLELKHSEPLLFSANTCHKSGGRLNFKIQSTEVDVGGLALACLNASPVHLRKTYVDPGELW